MARVADDFQPALTVVYYDAAANVPTATSLKVVDMRRYNIPLDVNQLVERYTTGETEQTLAKSLGVARGVVRNRLLRAGVKPRGRKEANTLRMSQLPAEERQRLTNAAHAAARGSTQTWEQRCKIAKSKEAAQAGIGPLEIMLADMLRLHGVSFHQQTAIGPYNADFTSGSVAVEVFGGHWHFSGRHLARAQKRFRYLLDSGWHALVVVVTESWPLIPACADYVVTFLEETSSNPALVRQYRMVGGNAQEFARQGADADQLAVVYPRRRSRDPLRRHS